MTNASHDTVTAASVAVEFGVKGAVRITRKTYATAELAEAAAARWRSSNSTGDYWAEVETTGAACICSSTVTLSEAVDCPACGPQLAEHLEAEQAAEVAAENAWLRSAEYDARMDDPREW